MRRRLSYFIRYYSYTAGAQFRGRLALQSREGAVAGNAGRFRATVALPFHRNEGQRSSCRNTPFKNSTTEIFQPSAFGEHGSASLEMLDVPLGATGNYAEWEVREGDCPYRIQLSESRRGEQSSAYLVRFSSAVRPLLPARHVNPAHRRIVARGSLIVRRHNNNCSNDRVRPAKMPRNRRAYMCIQMHP